MKTISIASTMNAAFKQTQFLPMFRDETIAGNIGARTLRPFRSQVDTQKRTSTAAPTAATLNRLPRPQAERDAGEAALLGLLTLSALYCIGQAMATMIELSPNWPVFKAWVAHCLS